jgi:hypothetical protein
MADRAEAPLDIATVLRRSLMAPLADPVPVFGGLVLLVIVPGLVTRLGHAQGDILTLLIVVRTLLAMLYAAATASVIIARVQGRPMALRAALARAAPGVQAALLIGAATVFGLTLQLFSRHGSVAGWALDALLLSAALLGASVLMPVVPLAVVEALAPVAAIRRAAALTSGNRNRILGLVLLVGLTLAPLAALGPASGSLWGTILFEAPAWLVAAVVPALVYAGLLESKL